MNGQRLCFAQARRGRDRSGPGCEVGNVESVGSHDEAVGLGSHPGMPQMNAITRLGSVALLLSAASAVQAQCPGGGCGQGAGSGPCRQQTATDRHATARTDGEPAPAPEAATAMPAEHGMTAKEHTKYPTCFPATSQSRARSRRSPAASRRPRPPRTPSWSRP